MRLIIDPDGTVFTIYSEAIDLAALGSPTITRASTVEPDSRGRWWVNLEPVGGPQIGPFPKRSYAVAAEVRWLHERLPTLKHLHHVNGEPHATACETAADAAPQRPANANPPGEQGPTARLAGPDHPVHAGEVR